MDGKLAFVTLFEDFVVVLDIATGCVLRTWGSYGVGAGEFEHLYGITIQRGIVLVSSRHRVHAFRKDGSLLWMHEAPEITCRFLVDGFLLAQGDDRVYMVQRNFQNRLLVHEMRERSLSRIFAVDIPETACAFAANNEELYLQCEAYVNVLAASDGTFLRKLSFLETPAVGMALSSTGTMICVRGGWFESARLASMAQSEKIERIAAGARLACFVSTQNNLLVGVTHDLLIFVLRQEDARAHFIHAQRNMKT